MTLRKTILITFWLVALCFSLQAALIDDFKQEVGKTKDKDAILKIVNNYVDKLKSVEDLRDLQNVWMQNDEAACRQYFAKQAKKESKNPVYQYLNLRLEEDPELQMEGAILLCKNSPKFYWGYRMLSVNFLEWMLNAESELANPLEGQDYKLGFIDAGLKNFPDDPYLNICQFHRCRIAKNQAGADAALLKLNDYSVLNSHWKKINEYLVQTANEGVYDQTIGKMISFEKQQKGADKVDSLGMHQFFKVYFLLETKNWEKLEQIFTANPRLKDDPNMAQAYRDYLLGSGKHQELIAIFAAAIDSGDAEYPDLTDEEYAVMDKEPGWAELKARAKARWDAGAEGRKQEALQNRSGKAATLWELPDKDGKILKLADLKGKIIILDFWATWCNPCRMVMPVLSQWMTSPEAKGVEVYSINVWDKGNAEKAKKMFADEGYNMTLLFGDDGLSKQYGFSGIPYLCVIDKAGKIAFAHTGASPTLAENLSIWVQELSKE